MITAESKGFFTPVNPFIRLFIVVITPFMAGRGLDLGDSGNLTNLDPEKKPMALEQVFFWQN